MTPPMPSYKLYKILHLTGIVAVCMTVAGFAFHAWLGGTKDEAGAARKRLLMAHGMAMLLVFAGGMGAAATSGFIADGAGFPGWIWIKFGLWGVFGALPALPYKSPKQAAWLFVVVPVLVAFAAWTAGGFVGLTR
jgi:hypothetical protein